MYIIAYKADEDRGAEADTVKYSDRIWFHEDGSANCLRSMIIHVSDKSPKPLSRICFLLPVPVDSVQEIEDASDTCLNMNFIFNSYKTGGYKVKEQDEHGGVILNDNFDNVVVCYRNKFCKIGIGNTTCVEAKFAKDIKPGEFRELRVRFSISSLAALIRGETYAVALPYFGDHTSLSDFKVATDQVRGHEEIPAIPIYNKDTKQGGFDVIVYLPPGMEGHDFPTLARKSIDRHMEDGSEGEEREKYMWRLREATDAERATFGLGLSLAGNWSYRIRPRLTEMMRMTTFLLMELKDLARTSSKAKWMGIAALIVAIAAVVLSLLH